MTGIEAWSTTAGSNNATPPNGAPEGMAPSAVNDTMRNMMAAVRTWYENPEWQDLGHTPTYISSTSFSVTGDKTSTYTVGRRLKLTGTTPFTAYATIVTSAFTTVTTITLVVDSGTIDNTLATVAVGEKTSNPASPRVPYDYAATTGSSNAYVLTLSPKLYAHVTGYPIAIKTNFANTGAATININGLGAVSLKKYGNKDLASGDLPSGWEGWIAYDGTNYQILSPIFDLEVFGFALSDETTEINAGTAYVTFRMPYAFTVTDVRAGLTTASTSGVVTVDINESGTTILSTKLTIDANEKTSTTAAATAVISDASIADDAEITIDIDTAGANATGLKVYIYGRRA